jgi:hypothetical protein
MFIRQETLYTFKPIYMTTSKKKAAKKATAKPTTILHLSDDNIDIEAFDKLVNANIPVAKGKPKRALAGLTETCPQGKQSKVTRDNPHMSPPINTANYITELHVKLSTQNLRITWLNGTVENWLCSPNPHLTPKGNDLVGNKCGPKHTNFSKDGMAWFTAFKSRGMAFGFHNSQRVGIGVVSHGCVRVTCPHAKTINQNSWSGKTVIKIIA